MLKAHPEKCVSCHACKLACSMHNFGAHNLRRDFIYLKEGLPHNELRVCDEEGHCAEVCPVGAISKDARGVHVIDREKCTGCGTCAKECPNKVIVMHEGKAWKCVSCGDCVKHCPYGAIEWVDNK